MSRSTRTRPGGSALASRPLGTLGDLHARAEHGSSARIVTRAWDGTAWLDTPGWRFFRQVIRIALYLREVAGVQAGHRVLVLSRLRTERLVAEWAAALQGAVVTTLGPDVDGSVLASALDELRPRVALVSGQGEHARLLGRNGARSVGKVIVLDGSTSAEGSSVPWSAVLDRGGTLDTAERAQAFRARAAALTPDMQAVAYPRPDTNGSPRWGYLTHGDLVRQLARCDGGGRATDGAREGYVAYVVENREATGARLALWALVSDPRATLALGTPGRAAQELDELRPRTLIGAAQMDRHPALSRPARWLTRLRDLIQKETTP